MSNSLCGLCDGRGFIVDFASASSDTVAVACPLCGPLTRALALLCRAKGE